MTYHMARVSIFLKTAISIQDSGKMADWFPDLRCQMIRRHNPYKQEEFPIFPYLPFLWLAQWRTNIEGRCRTYFECQHSNSAIHNAIRNADNLIQGSPLTSPLQWCCKTTEAAFENKLHHFLINSGPTSGWAISNSSSSRFWVSFCLIQMRKVWISLNKFYSFYSHSSSEIN